MAEISRGWRAGVAMFALNGLFFGVWASRVPAVVDRFALTPGALRRAEG